MKRKKKREREGEELPYLDEHVEKNYSTYNVIEGLSDVSKWGELPYLCQVLYIGFCFVFVLLHLISKFADVPFFFVFPKGVWLTLYVFWRGCYNIGLGLLLRAQSLHQSLVKFYRQRIKFFPSRKKTLSRHVSLKDREGKKMCYNFDEFSDSFNSWMLYRFLVDIILGCDVYSYIAFFVVFIELPKTVTFDVILQYIVGVILIFLSFLSKVSAENALNKGILTGYGWYWGDFFVRIKGVFKFEGIFKMVGHPMYSVGYLWYYGVSLISRSYTVFYISLLGHLGQFFFLNFCEIPHMEKLYKQTVKDAKENVKEYFKNKEVKLVFYLNFLDSSDLSLLVVVVYIVLSYFVHLPLWVYTAQVLFWLAFHYLVLGLILKLQSLNNFYVKMFPSKSRAFESWKKLYNLSATANYLVFIILALKNISIPHHWTVSKQIFNCFMSVILIGCGIWQKYGTYEASPIGDVGYYYGDFFLFDEMKEKKLYYSGIFRFMNNPDMVIGFCIQYGLGLFSYNRKVIFLAALSQILHYLFIKIVEEPGMKKIYGTIRKDGGINEVIKDTLNKSKVAKMFRVKSYEYIDHIKRKSKKLIKKL